MGLTPQGHHGRGREASKVAEEAAGLSPTFSFPAWVARTWCRARSSRKPAVTPCRLPGPVARTKGGSEPRQRVVLVGQHCGRAGFVLRYLYHTNAPLTAAAAKGWARLRHRSCAGLRGPRAAQTLVPAGGHTECLWAAADTSTTAPLDVRGRRLCRGASPHLRSALCWGAQRADFAFSSKPSVFERVSFF